ncbi:MAG TPA: Xaa-Pro peptidase family protein [Candidatus Manganitrophaceae bacterium]|nr:Xaa-Pro peptidase family protein [Candidatus Manganitrophaceae bacterium]
MRSNEAGAVLMIACSETDSNMYYASGFLAPDPFIYLQAQGRSMLLMSDLEVDRARAQSKVDEVLSYSEYENRAKSKGIEKPETVDVVDLLLNEKGAKELTVPGNFPLEYGDALRAKGFRLAIKREPFFERRAVKTVQEVEAIRKAQIAVEESVDEAFDLLRKAEIKEGLLYLDGSALTSESVRRRLHLSLMEKGCVAQHTIVACGVDACDPHNEGSGPLRANEPIIFDVFPRSSDNRYYADMSRTVVKGRASDGLKRLYDTVLEGQELGIRRIRNGVHGKAIHEEIVALFEKRGYHTGKVGGRMQGFFHGTGHGVGLDIHEPPRISKADWVLQTGEVVTVEPGLYYPQIGAVRIEDMVWVEENGCKNLTTYPKVLEIA